MLKKSAFLARAVRAARAETLTPSAPTVEKSSKVEEPRMNDLKLRILAKRKLQEEQKQQEQVQKQQVWKGVSDDPRFTLAKSYADLASTGYNLNTIPIFLADSVLRTQVEMMMMRKDTCPTGPTDDDVVIAPQKEVTQKDSMKKRVRADDSNNKDKDVDVENDDNNAENCDVETVENNHVQKDQKEKAKKQEEEKKQEEKEKKNQETKKRQKRAAKKSKVAREKSVDDEEEGSKAEAVAVVEEAGKTNQQSNQPNQQKSSKEAAATAAGKRLDQLVRLPESENYSIQEILLAAFDAANKVMENQRRFAKSTSIGAAMDDDDDDNRTELVRRERGSAISEEFRRLFENFMDQILSFSPNENGKEYVLRVQLSFNRFLVALRFMNCSEKKGAPGSIAKLIPELQKLADDRRLE